MNKIKITIADDHPVFLGGLKMILQSDSTLNIIGEAFNGKDALLQILNLQPQVAVLDLGMPDKNGLEIVRELREVDHQTDFIFLTMHDEEAMLNSALELGVKGYILKDSAVAEIVNAIRLVANGKNFISPKLSSYLVNKNYQNNDFTETIDSLTLTETKILRLIAEHKTTKEIAKELFVSKRTIDHHRYNICNKLNLRGINSLLKFAIENKNKFLKNK